jgi:hypothetical protein
MNQEKETQQNNQFSTDIKDIQGFIDVVAVAPTHTPKGFWDQIKYCSADTSLYFYDFKNHAWKSVTLS